MTAARVPYGALSPSPPPRSAAGPGRGWSGGSGRRRGHGRRVGRGRPSPLCVTHPARAAVLHFVSWRQQEERAAIFFLVSRPPPPPPRRRRRGPRGFPASTRPRPSTARRASVPGGSALIRGGGAAPRARGRAASRGSSNGTRRLYACARPHPPLISLPPPPPALPFPRTASRHDPTLTAQRGSPRAAPRIPPPSSPRPGLPRRTRLTRTASANPERKRTTA